MHVCMCADMCTCSMLPMKRSEGSLEEWVLLLTVWVLGMEFQLSGVLLSHFLLTAETFHLLEKKKYFLSSISRVLNNKLTGSSSNAFLSVLKQLSTQLG